MTASPRRAWYRPGTLIAAAATGVIGLGLCATPASAHTPNWRADCHTVELHLKAYNGRVTNTVTVTADGKELLKTTEFGSSFDWTHEVPAHTADVHLHLSVVAGDGKQFSKEDDLTVPACQDQSTPTPTPTETKTTESPKPSETPSESASTAPSAAPSTPSTDESPAGDLAETGASSSTPLIAGGAAVALLAGGGLLFANRKRRAAARH
ncbi:LAETG motif-containing sortase-dependent surface protein [Streptomyces sp. NPDC001902]|nr:LAETG motif-containing sortase-dependent surface protein [Streptomyces sp. PA03-1a]MDX2814771.1 LAETG motif-containing sortase-dependent surface protein [Streptomyces sp. PA03-5A]